MNSDSESCSCCCCATIAETERGIMQNCGKFSGIIDPGFACFCWPFTKIAGNVSTKLRQILIKKEAKVINVISHLIRNRQRITCLSTYPFLCNFWLKRTMLSFPFTRCNLQDPRWRHLWMMPSELLFLQWNWNTYF